MGSLFTWPYWKAEEFSGTKPSAIQVADCMFPVASLLTHLSLSHDDFNLTDQYMKSFYCQIGDKQSSQSIKKIFVHGCIHASHDLEKNMCNLAIEI